MTPPLADGLPGNTICSDAAAAGPSRRVKPRGLHANLDGEKGTSVQIRMQTAGWATAMKETFQNGVQCGGTQ